MAEKARGLGIKYFTVWFFSTENWKRSIEEVSYLMDLASSRSGLYFANVHCPDFDFEQFKLALEDYASRERRLGGDVNPQPKSSQVDNLAPNL